MKTKSEQVFEQFLIDNNLEFQRIKEDDLPRTDYLVKIYDFKLMFEITELAENKDFTTDQFPVSSCFSTTAGKSIRKKIQEKRKQMQFAAKQGFPSILLVYNNIDRWHLFGTENRDFISAMYGEYTVSIDKSKGKITDSFHGRNKSFAAAKNTSFSAVGRLSPYFGIMKVTLFENVFSQLKIQYDRLPACFDVINIQIETV